MSKDFTVYVAASWRHEHAVRLLTDELRRRRFEVKSFVEYEADKGRLAGNPNRITLEDWIWSEDGYDKFHYDTTGAMESSIVIFIGPSGTDAWAEVGAAYAAGVPILGLWAKGEDTGLMRRMMTQWYHNHQELFSQLEEYRGTRRGRSGNAAEPKSAAGK